MGEYSKYCFSLLFLFFSLPILLAQPEDNNQIDSLKQVLNKQQHDTSKVKVYVELGRLTRKRDYDLSLSYLRKAEELAQKNDFICEELYIQFTSLLVKGGNTQELFKYGNKGLSIFEDKSPSNSVKIYVSYANFYADQSKVDSAITYYEKALDLTRKHAMNDREAGVISNIGTVYYESGKYELASKYFIKALKMLEDLGDEDRLATIKGNLAIIYLMQEDYNDALKIMEEVLEIHKRQKNYSSIANTLNNIAGVYVKLGKIDEALNPLEESAKFYKKSGYKSGEAFAYNNLGVLTKKIGQKEKSLEYRLKSLEIYKSIDNEIGVASAYLALATFYHEESNTPKALDYALKAEEIYNRIEKLDKQVELNILLADVYNEMKLYQKSNDYLYKYVALKDSLIGIEKNKSIAEMKERYEAEEKEKKIALQEKSLIEKEAKNQKQQAKIYFIFIGLGVASLLSLLLIFGYRQKSKANKIISSQKRLVEQKNKEILDSITYAKRLQDAILPPMEQVKSNFEKSFILFRPKDIVSGDFYWMETKGDQVFLAAADCTGHGVPGAMVSVVCANALNKSVNEMGRTDPAEILNETRDIVIDTFAKAGSDVKDGMDISLVALRSSEVNESADGSVKLQWCGANNPIWIIRKDANEIEEIKANKQPIGLYGEIKPFNSHEVNLNQGDTIYMFSDGYPDQFGGEKGKKYKYGNFKKLLLSIQDKSMDKQFDYLDKHFDDWRGEWEQVDDVCVIGVRL